MPKVSGPRDGKEIEAKFNTHHTGPIPADSQLLITVSLNNEYFYGKWFEAFISIAKKKFSKVTILIVDAPNAHTLEADEVFAQKTFAERTKHALQLGANWWIKNKNTFEGIFQMKLDGSTASEQIVSFNLKQKTAQPNFEIVHWNEWVREFNDADIVKKQLEENIQLRTAIEATVKSFADRQGLTTENPFYHIRKEAFKRYLLEEVGGILVLANRRGYNFIAYPGAMLKAFEKTYEILVSPNSHKKASDIWLSVDFKRRLTKEQSIAEQQKKMLKLTNSEVGNDAEFNEQRAPSPEALQRELSELRKAVADQAKEVKKLQQLVSSVFAKKTSLSRSQSFPNFVKKRCSSEADVEDPTNSDTNINRLTQ